MINEMKNIPIIGCAVFIVIIIIGLCFYKTKEGMTKPKSATLMCGPRCQKWINGW